MDQENALDGQNTAAQDDKEAAPEEFSMEALLEQGELSLDMPRPGDVREGVIASVSGDEILVSIGAKSEGIIPAREVSQLSDEQRENMQVGQEITVYVVSPEGHQGAMALSITRALEEEDWDKAEKVMADKDTYEGEINGYNKGGLIVNLGALRGFVPASQVSMSRRMTYEGDTPEQRWNGMVGEPIVVRIIEVDRERRRLIMSERAASQESRETLKERLLEQLEVGETHTGRVTSLADFGAFVNIKGADGLVHLSEVSWERVDHPSEVLEVGQEIQVKIISIDHDRKRIGLSIRLLQEDPWEEQVSQYQVGQLVEGSVTRLTKFGAFAQIDENVEGLIHVSELSDRRIEHPKEVVSENDVLTLRIIKIDSERRRIGLSLRKVESMEYSDMDWELALSDIDMDDLEDGAAEETPAAEEAPAAEADMDVEDKAAEEPAVAEEAEETADEAANAEEADAPEAEEESPPEPEPEPEDEDKPEGE